MIFSVLASLLLSQVVGDPIIGGRSSEVHQFPWVVSIQENDRHMCGGSIISNVIILTAAHCVMHRPQSYVVRVGSTRTDSGGTVHEVVGIRRHEHHNASATHILDVSNDVALIKVSPSIDIGRYGAEIVLPTKSYKVPPGTNVTVVGWGSTSQTGHPIHELRSIKQFITDDGECARAYYDTTGNWIRSTHLICAHSFHSGTCLGDSGSPLVTNDDIQVGIVIGGLGCAEQFYPGVYQNVAYYYGWIHVNLIDLTL